MFDSVWPHGWQPTRLPHPWDSPGKNTGVGCHFLLQCMKVKSESEVAQLCLTFSNPMDCSLPGSSIHGFSRQEYWSRVPLPSPLSYIGSPSKNGIKFTPPQTCLSKEKEKINKCFKSIDQKPGRRRFQLEGLTRAKTEASPRLGTKMLSVAFRTCSEVRAQGCVDEPTCNVWEERNWWDLCLQA